MALPLLRSSLSEACAAAECKNFSGPGSENEPILSPLEEAQQTLEIGTSPVETPVLPDLIDDDDDEDDVEGRDGGEEGGDEADDVDGDNSYDLDGGEVHNREM